MGNSRLVGPILIPGKVREEHNSKHRITERCVLEGTSGDHPVQPTC